MVRRAQLQIYQFPKSFVGSPRRDRLGARFGRSNHGGINTNEEAKKSAESFISQTDKRMIRFIVTELSQNPRGMSDTRARAKIIEWINCSDARRSVLFMTKEQMKTYANENLPKSARPKPSAKVEPYQNALVEALEERDSEDSSTDDDSL